MLKSDGADRYYAAVAPVGKRLELWWERVRMRQRNMCGYGGVFAHPTDWNMCGYSGVFAHPTDWSPMKTGPLETKGPAKAAI